ncbi:MAG: hypothetical protein QM296_11310 [Bacillota bacterium]|nr:hypothetical protein [Bacillota bacterium]
MRSPRPVSRFLPLLLLPCLLIALTGRLMAFRAGIALRIEAPGQVTVGEQFEVLISVSADMAADSGSLLLSYDPQCFHHDGTQAGSDTAVSTSGGDGQLTLNFASLPAGESRLAVLLINAKSPGSARFTIENSRFTAGGEELGSSAAVYAFVVAVEPPTAPPTLSTATAAPTGFVAKPPPVVTVDRLPDDEEPISTPVARTQSQQGNTAADSSPSSGPQGKTSSERLTDSPLELPDGEKQGSTKSARNETITEDNPLPGEVETTSSRPSTENPFDDEELLELAQRLERIVPLILIPIIVLVVALIIRRIVRRRP